MSLDLEAQAAAWAIKHVLYLILGAAVLVVLAFVYYEVFVRPGNIAAENALLKAQSVVNSADTTAAHDAVGTISATNGAVGGVGDKVRTQYVYVTKQPGADALVGDAEWSAFIASECVFNSTRNDPQCRGLPQHSP